MIGKVLDRQPKFAEKKASSSVQEEAINTDVNYHPVL
jgi:hypothetical protein